MVEIVSIRDTRDEALLARVYDELYLPNFGMVEEEREPLSYYANNILSPMPDTHLIDMLVALDGDEIKGFVVFEVYGASFACLMTFIAVSKEKRQRGIGRILFASLQQRVAGSVTAIFAECHKPECVDAEKEPIPPQARLHALSSLGASIVPIDYTQPALCEGGQRSKSLLLVTFPRQGHEPPKTVYGPTVSRFLRVFYGALGVENVAADPDFLAAQVPKPLEAFAKYQIPVAEYV